MSEQENLGWGNDTQEEWRDAEYVAVLRDVEPAGTAEFAEMFGVSMDEARGRLKRLHEGENAPVKSKRIGGSLVWFVNESKLEADAETAAEEIRKRMGIGDGQ